MKITITDGNSVSNFQVDNDQLIEDVKALVEAEMGVPFQRCQLYYEGKVLQNNVRLNQAGVIDGGLLFLSIATFQQPRMQPAQQQPKKGLGLAAMIKNFDKQVKEQGGFTFQTISDQEYLKQAQDIFNQLSGNASKVNTLRSTEPQIADCVDKKDIKGLAKIIKTKRQQKLKKIMDQEKRFQQLSKDPMNPEYQRMLQERIHQQNIDKNLEFAQQYVPEVFGQIHMLYINARINKIPIQAFVDSGAQSTIMSESLAQRCGLMRLVDKRYAGTAVGVGSCKILGKIHAADIQIEGKFLTCAFTVIENNSVEFLLGLDMLKRFSCLIDLKKNELNFQDGLIITKFLADFEINKNINPTKKEDIQPKLKKLIQMGFTKEESLAALQSCNYNEEVAGNILMQRKYGK